MGYVEDNDIKRAGMPAILRDADPFAVPRATAPAPASPVDRVPAGPPANSPAVPCPCSCECGNPTEKTYAELESLSSARFLRCEPCGRALHFGPNWTTATPAAAVPSGSGDAVVTGDRAGETIVIRHRVVDPVEEQWNREVAQQLATERRETARERWLERLPERWQMPYDDGEELVPEVTDRLARLRAGKAGEHGTSLLCIGPFGTGKTWVAYTYARAAVDQWLLWPQEIQIGTEAEIMEPIALASPWEVAPRSAELLKPTLKMLVIDDVGALGTYKNVENRYATWTKVVNWMYEHKRALVLTTNKALGAGGELEQWIGPTAYERLKHMVGERQVFRDENKRGEMAALWEAEYQAMQAAQGRD